MYTHIHAPAGECKSEILFVLWFHVRILSLECTVKTQQSHGHMDCVCAVSAPVTTSCEKTMKQIQINSIVNCTGNYLKSNSNRKINERYFLR